MAIEQYSTERRREKSINGEDIKGNIIPVNLNGESLGIGVIR